MTDFFADLEQEIRAAHPRRSRPVVPARGLAAATAVAAMIVALVLAVGSLSPTAGREAAAPTPESGWTEYAPLDCAGSGEVVDGRIPDEIVDRFAILRGDTDAVDLPQDRIPAPAITVVRQSLRVIDGPHGRRYVFALVRLATGACEPGKLAACIVGLDSGAEGCLEAAERPFEMTLTDELPDGRTVVIVIGDDGIRRVRMDLGPSSQGTEIELEANVGFRILPAGAPDIGIEPIDP